MAKLVRMAMLASGAAAAAGTLGMLAIAGAVRRRGMPLRGARVLITGGSRGLGFALAQEFAQSDARVAICGRNQDALQRAQLKLRQQGHEVEIFQCDVTDSEQVNRLVTDATAALGGIDILINNAGVIQVGPWESMTQEDYERCLRTHFWGPFHATMAVVAQMRRRHSGRIVNISSIGGKISVPHLLPYCVSKYALAAFSEGMAAELCKDGIFVTTVYPGLMRTGSPRNAEFKSQHRREYGWFSVSDALPLVSMSARRAARKIVRACARGNAALVLTPQAKAAIWMEALAPGLSAQARAWAAQLLPSPGGIGVQSAKGCESHSAVSPSMLTTLDERAAQALNQG